MRPSRLRSTWRSCRYTAILANSATPTAAAASMTFPNMPLDFVPASRGAKRRASRKMRSTARHNAAKNRTFDDPSSKRPQAPSAAAARASAPNARTARSQPGIRDIGKVPIRRQRHARARMLRNRVKRVVLRKKATSDKYREPVANGLK